MGRGLCGRYRTPIGTFLHSPAIAQRSLMLSNVRVGVDTCPSYYFKIVFFGQTSSRDDVAIIHHV